jgi:hypothetical protein
MNDKQLSDLALRKAMEFFLCDLPESMPADELWAWVCEDDTDVIVWEPFWSWGIESVRNAIEEMQASLVRQYRTVMEKAK